MFGREDKRAINRTMLPGLKNNAAAGYQGPVKIELLKGAGLLPGTFMPTWIYPCISKKCGSLYFCEVTFAKEKTI